ncbi:rRNA maturation RNase YbeY [Nocardioidaceae bacterium]|nr:rRNA maturation RNase YbeY [Nocardioidaceae bacterium]
MNIEVLDESSPEGDEPGSADPGVLADPADRAPSPDDVARLAAYVMHVMRVHPEAELAVRLVEPDVIAALNEQWMGKEGPTDVLAFPMDELRPAAPGESPEEGVLGDLVVCPAVAAQQAETVRAQGDAAYTTAREVELLVTHGILHLLGHDHAEPEEHRVMFGLQAQLLEAWCAGGTTPEGFDPLAGPEAFPATTTSTTASTQGGSS